MLRLLNLEPGQSAADFAQRLGYVPQSIALTVGQAERHGLIQRTPHPIHGRVRQLFLTDTGQSKFAHASEIIQDLEEQLHDGLDQDAIDQLKSGSTRSPNARRR